MEIQVFSAQKYDLDYFNRYNDTGINMTYHTASLSGNTIDLVQQGAIICCFVNDDISVDVLQELHKKEVQLIALRCAGFNNVDLEKAKELGIKVCRVPAYSPNAVAEHTVALLLALNRKIHKAYNRVREGNFNLNGLLGFDLKGKTIGIVGSGNIGSIFAKIMSAFDAKVIIHDPNITTHPYGTIVDFETLCTESDVISLHCPLTSTNKYLINKNTIDLMKSGVFILNTGRGALIHTKDLIDGLKSKHIGGVALDVYEQESELFFYDHSADIIEDDQISRLMTFPNVIITAHQGFFTDEALQEISQTTFENIKSFINKKTNENFL